MSEPSANAELGDPAYGSDAGAITYEAGEAISRGDAVGIDGGTLRPTNTGDTDVDVVGIAGEAASASGDLITVYVEGRIVANVAGAVSAGNTVAASGTDGQLAEGAGNIVALSDAGATSGLQAGYNLDANAAVVEMK